MVHHSGCRTWGALDSIHLPAKQSAHPRNSRKTRIQLYKCALGTLQFWLWTSPELKTIVSKNNTSCRWDPNNSNEEVPPCCILLKEWLQLRCPVYKGNALDSSVTDSISPTFCFLKPRCLECKKCSHNSILFWAGSERPALRWKSVKTA